MSEITADHGARVIITRRDCACCRDTRVLVAYADYGIAVYGFERQAVDGKYLFLPLKK